MRSSKYNVPPRPSSEWSYTIDGTSAYGPVYQGRRLIGRDTPVVGGVYFGAYEGEAIVVDPDKNPEPYEHLMELATSRANDRGKVVPSRVLSAVYDTVREAMSPSQVGVDRLLGKIARSRGRARFVDGTKVDLGVFLEQGVGVCRHYGLAATYLLQEFQRNQIIRGQASVDRSMQIKPNGERSGHAWARYTSFSGSVMILDPSAGYLGSANAPHTKWDYLRPNEH